MVGELLEVLLLLLNLLLERKELLPLALLDGVVLEGMLTALEGVTVIPLSAKDQKRHTPIPTVVSVFRHSSFTAPGVRRCPQNGNMQHTQDLPSWAELRCRRQRKFLPRCRRHGGRKMGS